MTILPAVELLEDPLLVDRLDARLGEGVVGDQPDLPAGEADGLVALGVHGHRHQRDGDLLAGGEQLVHLALGRGCLPPQTADSWPRSMQIVGGVAHGADDDDDLISLIPGGDRARGGAVNPLGVGDAGAAEFLNN